MAALPTLALDAVSFTNIDAAELLTRRGIVEVDRITVEERGPLLMQVMRDLLVTRCEYDYASNKFTYSALSPHFDVLPDGVLGPRYNAVIHTVDGEFSHVAWTRVGAD